MKNKKCITESCTNQAQSNRKRCKKCQKKYQAEYYMNNKEKYQGHNFHHYYDPAVIERELRGETPIPGGAFEGCSYDQIEALKTGNVEMLRKLKL